MIRVVRERRVDAPSERVWQWIQDPARFATWFALAERLEILEGEGAGRRQRLHGRWGRKRSEVDQVVTAWEPNRLLEWKHLEERLDGEPAPRFAKETVFAIRLEPDGDGTRVQLDSRQEPAGPVRGFVMRLFGTRELTGALERSLDTLAAAVGANRPPA